MNIRKKQKEERREKKNLFIVCYTALSLILLAFFICLNSMATLTEERVQEGMYSVKTAFGILPGSLPGLGNKPVSIKNYSIEGIGQEIISKLLNIINSTSSGNDVFLGVISRGLVLSLKEDLLFPKGSIRLKPGCYPVLHQAANIIRSCKNRIRIEGHADNSPVKSKRFSSNFELSAARALTVLRFFTEVEKIPEKRLYAVGCGEYRPLFPNDTEEHRAKNRRVWIVFEGKPKKIQTNQINIHGFNFKIGGFFK